MKTLVKNEFRQTRKTLLIWLGIMYCCADSAILNFYP